MNYNRGILQYIMLAIVYMVAWYWLERIFVYSSEQYDIFPLIVGTHGGYGFYLMISSVFMLVYLFMMAKEVKPFCVITLSRVDRNCVLKKCLFKVMKCGAVYTFVYVMVQVLCVCINVDMKQLMEANYFPVMAMYYVAAFTIFCFGGMCYLLLYICFHHSYIAMIVTITINMFIAYFVKTDLLYGGLTIVDEMTRKIPINVILWIINQLINICIIAVIYVITEEIYRKKDIV